MDGYKLELLEKAKEIISSLGKEDLERITIDLNDGYEETTDIRIDIELKKQLSHFHK